MNLQRHDCFYGAAAEVGRVKSELANLSTFNERKYFHLSVNRCEVAVKSFLGFILEEIPGVMTMLSRSSASLTPESKAMASSSIVRDAFPTIYPPGPSIASVTLRQPKRKRLDLRKVEKNEKKMQQIAKNVNSLAKEGSEEQVNHYEEYDPYVITVLNQL